jgi:hypothetical protein
MGATGSGKSTVGHGRVFNALLLSHYLSLLVHKPRQQVKDAS